MMCIHKAGKFPLLSNDGNRQCNLKWNQRKCASTNLFPLVSSIKPYSYPHGLYNKIPKTSALTRWHFRREDTTPIYMQEPIRELVIPLCWYTVSYIVKSGKKSFKFNEAGWCWNDERWSPLFPYNSTPWAQSFFLSLLRVMKHCTSGAT
jgi:hypothetical protein